MSSLKELTNKLVRELHNLSFDERVEALNEVRRALHDVSPFREEPVDCVQWVRADEVKANIYNPNRVAPRERELLEHSIRSDGFTQPIVGFQEGEASYEVVDGFHRNLVGREAVDIRSRLHGYLPLVVINEDRKGVCDRMAATIRHNRARGKHLVDSMSDIVVELSRRNWKDEKIARELGMDADEVLRLKQTSGLSEVFRDREFSEAWEPAFEETDEV